MTQIEKLLNDSNHIGYAYRALETDRAKAIRQGAGLSLNSLGKRTKTSASCIAAWERGEWQPTLSKAISYGKALSELQEASDAN